jgi:DNA-binding NtrC family response regulator
MGRKMQIGCVVGKPVVAFAGTRYPSAGHWDVLLIERGWDVLSIPDGLEFPSLVRVPHIDVTVLTVPPDGITQALSLFATLRQTRPLLRAVLVAAETSEALVLAALRAGVSDVLRTPVSDAELLESVERTRARSEPPPRLARPALTRSRLPDYPIIGESRVIHALRGYVERVARTDGNVLITGETGVGKELVAEMIHARSPRSGRPCVAINCAAIPDTLLESELFGFERGAFTGADRRSEGTLKSADGGSVFFDEIGDMGMATQAKILRAIEAREVRRLGGGSRVPLDVRVIAATNQSLERLVAEGRFRKDLYYRLNVARIDLPPLRERLDDLDLLLAHYIDYFNRRCGRHVEGFTPEALAPLRRYDWPGNVRELKNLVEAIFVDFDGRWVTPFDLPEAFRNRLAAPADAAASERERLVRALFVTRWNKSKAAEELKWSRMTLYRKLAKYHVERDGLS